MSKHKVPKVKRRGTQHRQRIQKGQGKPHVSKRPARAPRGGDQCLYRITYIVKLQDVIRKLYSDVLHVRGAFVHST